MPPKKIDIGSFRNIESGIPRKKYEEMKECVEKFILTVLNAATRKTVRLFFYPSQGRGHHGTTALVWRQLKEYGFKPNTKNAEIDFYSERVPGESVLEKDKVRDMIPDYDSSLKHNEFKDYTQDFSTYESFEYGFCGGFDYCYSDDSLNHADIMKVERFICFQPFLWYHAFKGDTPQYKNINGPNIRRHGTIRKKRRGPSIRHRVR